VSAVPVARADVDSADGTLRLANLGAGVGSGTGVPEEGVAVRYDSDEALLAAIRLRRADRAGD